MDPGGANSQSASVEGESRQAGVAFPPPGAVGICRYHTSVTTVTCQLPTLGPGQSEDVFIYAAVKPSTLPGSMSNTAAAAASGSRNANGNVTTSVQTSADLVIVLTSDLLVYKPSTTIHYQITVNNFGPSDAQNVVITQALPNVKQGKYISNNI